MSWYYVEAGAQRGPFDEDKFRELVLNGTIRAETLVWREGMKEWATYAVVAGVQSPGGAPPVLTGDEAACIECKRVFPRKNMVAYDNQMVCAGCRDVYFQKVREGVAPVLTETGMVYGGFWIRFLAKFIDGILLTVVNMILQFGFQALFMTSMIRSDGFGAGDIPAGFWIAYLVLFMLQMLVSVTYVTFFTWKYSATPGKMALSLKIIRSDGSKLTFGRALGRAFAEFVSQLILYIGYIMAGFDEEKRALHDHMCDTRVVRT